MPHNEEHKTATQKDDSTTAIDRNRHEPTSKYSHEPEPSNRSHVFEQDELYVRRNGKLVRIEKDPEDNLHKVRITDDAYEGLVTIQKGMRRVLAGYKPDITLVCSALLESMTKQEEQSINIVRHYALNLFDESSS